MAILDPQLLEGPVPTTDEIRFEQADRPRLRELEVRIRCYQRWYLHRLQRIADRAVAQSKAGRELPEHRRQRRIRSARNSVADHEYYLHDLFQQHPDLLERINRHACSTRAPGKAGECGLELPVSTAAMTMLWGWNSDYYQGVHVENDGREDTRFVTAVAQGGILPIAPAPIPLPTLEKQIKQHRDSDPRFLDPVFVNMNISIQRARELLMGMLPDAALYVSDERGGIQQVITRHDVDLDRYGKVKNSKDFQYTSSRPLSHLPLHRQHGIRTMHLTDSDEDFERVLRKAPEDHSPNAVRQVPLLDENGVVRKMLTSTQLHCTQLLKPFLSDGKLGFGVAIGLNDPDAADRIDLAIRHGASYIALETAHAYRRDVMQYFESDVLPAIGGGVSLPEEWTAMQVECIIDSRQYLRKIIEYIRKKAGDRKIMIGFGTVTSPAAVRELSILGIDVVKVGIGGGQQCDTFDVTGVGGLPFRYFVECGQEAHALGMQIQADGGIRGSRDNNYYLSLDGVGFTQSGSFFAGTAEAYSPVRYNASENNWERRTWGEAARAAVLRRAAVQGVSVHEFSEELTHSEGRDQVRRLLPGGSQYVLGCAALIKMALQSALSYSDATNMTDYQRYARLTRTSKSR
jgi:hypothetical protein